MYFSLPKKAIEKEIINIKQDNRVGSNVNMIYIIHIIRIYDINCRWS